MRELFRRWLEAGAEAKKKWVLYAASIHGGEEIIPLLHEQIKELPGKFRGALAGEAVPPRRSFWWIRSPGNSNTVG